MSVAELICHFFFNFQDLQPAMGRCPARPEPSPLQGAPCRLAATREGQSVVLPTRGDALRALRPDLEKAGGGVRPVGPPPEEDGHTSDS